MNDVKADTTLVEGRRYRFTFEGVVKHVSYRSIYAGAAQSPRTVTVSDVDAGDGIPWTVTLPVSVSYELVKPPRPAFNPGQVWETDTPDEWGTKRTYWFVVVTEYGNIRFVPSGEHRAFESPSSFFDIWPDAKLAFDPLSSTA